MFLRTTTGLVDSITTPILLPSHGSRNSNTKQVRLDSRRPPVLRRSWGEWRVLAIAKENSPSKVITRYAGVSILRHRAWDRVSEKFTRLSKKRTTSVSCHLIRGDSSLLTGENRASWAPNWIPEIFPPGKGGSDDA